MSSLLDRVRSAASPYGLNLVAGIAVERYDRAVGEPYRASAIAPAARSIVAIGNGGGALWSALKRHAERHPEWWARENPLDDFTRQVMDEVVGPATRGGTASCTVVYPFLSGGATLNFMELGKLAGLAGPSILGVALHPSYGPWIAFRAALLVDEVIDSPGAALGFDPCPTCATRACMAACPVGAVGYPAGWDIPKCLTHRVEVEPDCATRCHARVACVLGPEHRYPDDELAYHQMRALRAMRPWYEKNLKPKARD